MTSSTVPQDTDADQEQLEAARQRLAQQKLRFQNALVDSVNQREAFEPTTYAEVLEVRLALSRRVTATKRTAVSGKRTDWRYAHADAADVQDYRWMFAQSPDGLDESGVAYRLPNKAHTEAACRD